MYVITRLYLYHIRTLVSPRIMGLLLQTKCEFHFRLALYMYEVRPSQLSFLGNSVVRASVSVVDLKTANFLYNFTAFGVALQQCMHNHAIFSLYWR